MYRDAHDDVLRLGEAVRRRDRLLRRLASAQAEADRLQAQLRMLEKSLTKEERDVERFEGTSLTRLLLSAMGKAEERLDKERQEALEARLRVEAKAAELESTKEEVDRLRQELEPLRNVDAEYERAFMDKLGRIRQQGDETARRLEMLIAEVTQAAGLVQEIDEAISAGAWAERHLHDAIKNVETLEQEAAAILIASTVVFTIEVSTSIPTPQRLEHNLRAAYGWIGRYARELADIPGWNQTGTMIISYANLLIPFINIVAGGSKVEANRSKAAVHESWRQVSRVQEALRAARPSAVAHYEDAFRRYREAVEYA